MAPRLRGRTAAPAGSGASSMLRKMAAAADSGNYALPRKEGSDHAMPVAGMTSTIMTRLASTETRDGCGPHARMNRRHTLEKRNFA